MAFYEELQEAAIEMFEEFGFIATLNDAVTREKSKVKVVSMGNEKAALLGMTVSAQHRAFYVSPESKVKVKTDDFIEFGSGSNKRAYTFRDVMELTPDGSTVMYYMGTAT